MFRACKVFAYTRHTADPARSDGWISITTIYAEDTHLGASPTLRSDIAEKIRKAIDLNLNGRRPDDIAIVDGYQLWCPEAIALWIYRLASDHEEGGTGRLIIESVRVCYDIHGWIEYRPGDIINHEPLPG